MASQTTARSSCFPGAWGFAVIESIGIFGSVLTILRDLAIYDCLNKYLFSKVVVLDLIPAAPCVRWARIKKIAL